MNVIGLGIDLVETRRIAESLEKFGDHFLQRVFTEGEIAYASAHVHAPQHFAARFAAKEAISKAFGTGIGPELGWLDLEVVREPNGAPGVLLHGKAQELAQRRGVHQILLSLAHTKHYATAQVLLLGAG